MGNDVERNGADAHRSVSFLVESPQENGGVDDGFLKGTKAGVARVIEDLQVDKGKEPFELSDGARRINLSSERGDREGDRQLPGWLKPLGYSIAECVEIFVALHDIPGSFGKQQPEGRWFHSAPISEKKLAAELLLDVGNGLRHSLWGND